MWEKLAVDVGVQAVARLFAASPKKEAGTIAVGLAVGYYYNFLDIISDVIERDEMAIHSSQDDKTPRKFDADHVNVHVIIPAHLNVQAFQRCEAEFKNTVKGQIYLHRQKRYYGLNYEVMGSGDDARLTIVDLARPVMSIKHYYEKILKQDTNTATNELWNKSEITEITAFKTALRKLQEIGYGGLVNKLDFRERA